MNGLVVGIPDFVTERLTDLVIEVVNERLGVCVTDLVASFVVGRGEPVKVRVVVGEGETDAVRVGVGTKLLDKTDEYDTINVGLWELVNDMAGV